MRVALQSDERVIKTKRTKTVRRSAENPQFKQSFEFSLDDTLATSFNDSNRDEDYHSHLLNSICLAFYVCVTRSSRLQVRSTFYLPFTKILQYGQHFDNIGFTIFRKYKFTSPFRIKAIFEKVSD